MVMDPNTARQLADIRQRLSQLESALGAHTLAEAGQVIRRLAGAVQQLRQDMNAGQDQIVALTNQLSPAQDQLVQLRTRGNQLAAAVQSQQAALTAQQAQIDALNTWALTVTPPGP